MANLKDYGNLIVVEYIPVGITAFLAGIINFTFKAEYLSGIIAVLFTLAAYNTYNSIIDKAVDKINKPFRPIPKKSIKESEAFRLSIFFYILSIIVSFFINQTAMLIVLSMVIITIAYSDPIFHLKTRFLLGTITAVSLYTVMIPAFGWSINQITAFPVELIIFLFLVGIPSGILKDFADMSGDGYGRIKSLPLVIGYKNSKILSIIFYLLSLTVLIFFITTQKFSIYHALLIFPVLMLIFNITRLKNKFSGSGSIEKSKFQNSLTLLMIIELYIFLVNNFLSSRLYLF